MHNESVLEESENALFKQKTLMKPEIPRYRFFGFSNILRFLFLSLTEAALAMRLSVVSNNIVQFQIGSCVKMKYGKGSKCEKIVLCERLGVQSKMIGKNIT